MKSRKGSIFMAWVAALEALGYQVDWRVLCAADYGDPTTRRRLFVQAVRGRRRIVWPEPTHAPAGETDLLGTRKAWRGAREIIDWTIPGTSIYDRKKPLSPKTMDRIMAGLEKFSLRPFVVPNFGERTKQPPRSHDLDEPLPTVTSKGAGNVVQPYLIEMRGTSRQQVNGSARSLDDTIGTVTAGGIHHALCEPFIVAMENGESVRDINNPLNTITTAKGGAHALVEPFILSAGGPECPARPVSEPMGTVLTRDHRALVTPYLVHTAHVGESAGRTRSIKEPLPVVSGNRGDLALCEPALLPQQQAGALRPVSQPCPTVATVEPFLVEYYGNGSAESVRSPLNTVTTKDRHALVRPMVILNGKHYELDIRFRMLKPHELSAAQGFPLGYQFSGNKTEQVKQIGNAVPPGLARALVTAAITGNKRTKGKA